MKCLVVDDSSTMRRIVVNTLKSMGITEIIEAGDGAEGLAKLDASVDLIITDSSTRLAGLDLVRSLRGNSATTRTPVLMVSARNVEVDVKQAIEAGVSGYLLKPFTPSALKEKVRQLMALA